ncbi:MAG TPA: hypothetical protein PLY87_25440 [Planctomycetaceae bacterium]|nr:hypothetical protein [Planctomycetaceae bacterium]
MASNVECCVVVFALAFELLNVESRQDKEQCVILAKRANDIFDLLQLRDINWWEYGFAATGLIVLIWAIVRVTSRVNEDVDPAVSDQEMLNSISELRREGDLTEDEYRSIKSQLMGRMSTTLFHQPKKKSGAKAEPAAALLSKILSQKLFSEPQEEEAPKSEESESVQSITSSSLTKVPTLHQDTTDKTTKSVAPETETGDGN